MYYDKTNDKELNSFYEVKKARPSVSFPKKPTEEQLNSQGIFTVVEVKDAYTKYQELIEHPIELIDDIYTKRYEAINRPIEECKELKLREIKQSFTQSMRKPTVDAVLSDDLTITVDAGRVNKDDFKEKWEHMEDGDVTIIKDANNDFHTDIAKEQVKIVYDAIYNNGEALYGKKWSLETQVSAAENIEEIEDIKW